MPSPQGVRFLSGFAVTNRRLSFRHLSFRMCRREVPARLIQQRPHLVIVRLGEIGIPCADRMEGVGRLQAYGFVAVGAQGFNRVAGCDRHRKDQT